MCIECKDVASFHDQLTSVAFSHHWTLHGGLAIGRWVFDDSLESSSAADPLIEDLMHGAAWGTTAYLCLAKRAYGENPIFSRPTRFAVHSPKVVRGNLRVELCRV